MLAICIECSHQRGMGHLFRALNFVSTLKEKREPCILLVNRDETALSILREKNIMPVIVDLEDISSDWEGKLIREKKITVWLNDRLHTGIETAEHVKAEKIPLFTIDDMGRGAALADGNFASLIFEGRDSIPGKKVYAGSDYLILNPEIARYRRKRDKLETILVTLGGSDTYGVTLPVIDFLKNWEKETGVHKKVSILIGPGSRIREEAERAIEGTGFTLLSGVASLIELFSRFDFAITGGGVTALEAAASGLPCMVVANEVHEIQIGQYLERNGCALFAGYYKEMNPGRIKEMEEVGKISEMSQRGPETVDLSGAERICSVIYTKAITSAKT